MGQPGRAHRPPWWSILSRDLVADRFGGGGVQLGTLFHPFHPNLGGGPSALRAVRNPMFPGWRKPSSIHACLGTSERHGPSTASKSSPPPSRNLQTGRLRPAVPDPALKSRRYSKEGIQVFATRLRGSQRVGRPSPHFDEIKSNDVPRGSLADARMRALHTRRRGIAKPSWSARPYYSRGLTR